MNNSPGGSRTRVLVVDDDAISLQLATVLLEAEGFEVEQAEGGEEALRRLAERPMAALPEVMLVDLQMPGISGNALAARLRGMSNAPVIAMSATEPAEELIEGFDGFMLKPLDVGELRARLQREGGKAAPAREARAAADEDETVLDLTVLAKLRRVMPPAAVAEVFAACLSDTRRRVPQMRERAEAGDLAEVRAAAHTIKGGAGMVGAVRIATLAAQLEQGVYQKDVVQPRLDDLLSACDEAERILLRYTDLQG